MTARIKFVFASIALLIITMACSTLLGDDLPETEYSEIPATQAATEEPVLKEAPSCPVITDQILALAVSGDNDVEENLLESEITLVTYSLSGDELIDPFYEEVPSDLQDEQNDEQTHRQVWDYFRAVVPASERERIGEYSIITDGQGGTLAAVSQTQSDPNLWALQVDIADTGNYYELTYTLLHEFGHLITLGSDQVPPSLAVFNNPDDDNIYFEEASACPDYFPGEGCANPHSYINDFYNQFWTDIHEEWNEINLEEDSDNYYEKLDEFYYKYEDQFVASYAATSPEEDIAEAFAFFIFSHEPAGDTVVEQKVLFFYHYPELVELRANLLGNLCISFPE
ncbi:MAG: hypothetical protein Q8L41_16805 [Anaerolineales bacterium]|nr:hypothetical protein [Anaerolineales bacterium]